MLDTPRALIVRLFVVFVLASTDTPLIWAQSALDSIHIRAEQAKSVAESSAIYNQAAIQLKDTDIKKSLQYAQLAYGLVSKLTTPEHVQASLSVGRCYSRLGDHELAMKQFVEALHVSEKLNDRELIRTSYKVMGSGYYFKKDRTEALACYRKALALSPDDNPLDESTADLKNNIALVFTDTKKFDSATVYLQEAIRVYEALQRNAKLSNSWLNLAELHYTQNKFKEAEENLMKALAMNRSLGTRLTEGYALNNLCHVMMKQHRLIEAREYGEQALRIGHEEQFESLILDAYENLLLVALEAGDIRSAKGLYPKVDSARNRVSDLDKKKISEELRTKYEIEKVELENANLQRESDLRGSQLVTSWVFLAISLALVVVALALVVFYRRALEANKRYSEQIRQQHEEISAQAEQLTRVNNEIANINQNLEKTVEQKTATITEQNAVLLQIAYRNAHKVRGPLARILGLSHLITEGLLTTEELPVYVKEIKKAAEEMDVVVKEINTSIDVKDVLPPGQ